MLNASGRLAPEEYLQALYLHERPPRTVSRLIPWIIGGYLFAILLHGVKHFSGLEITVLVFPLLITTLWQLVFLPDQARANFDRDITLSYRYEFTITSTQLTISSKLEACVLTWSDISHYKVNSSLVLLYVRDSEFYVVPWRWFETDEDICLFRDRLHTALGKPRW